MRRRSKGQRGERSPGKGRPLLTQPQRSRLGGNQHRWEEAEGSRYHGRRPLRAGRDRPARSPDGPKGRTGSHRAPLYSRPQPCPHSPRAARDPRVPARPRSPPSSNPSQ